MNCIIGLAAFGFWFFIEFIDQMQGSPAADLANSSNSGHQVTSGVLGTSTGSPLPLAVKPLASMQCLRRLLAAVSAWKAQLKPCSSCD